MNPTVDRLKLLTVTRTQLLRAELRTENQIAAIGRVALGQLKGKQAEVPEATRNLYRKVADDINPTLAIGSEACRKVRRQVEKEIEQAAKQLPCWSWVESDVRGLGALGLGLLVGMAASPYGEGLERFKNPSALWKRMGLAVIDGKRQQKIANGAELAIRHGYSPSRRSLMFVLSESLIKQNKGYYKDVYDRRKQYEKDRKSDILPIVAHRRAMRYMIKRLLKDLWCTWNNLPLQREESAA